jgi:hypothetical protein
MNFLNSLQLARLSVTSLLVLAAACSDTAGPSGGNVTVVLRRGSNAPTLSETGRRDGTRTPSTALQAAPATCPFPAAGVTIDEIYLQGAGGRTTLRSDPATVDLCDLGGQALLLVNQVEVPAGSYQGIRFVISGGYVQDPADGNVYATEGYALPAGVGPAGGILQTPSWGSSGLKVDFEHGPVTVDGGQKVIGLDIDLAQSFGRLAGGSSQWVMSPVIKAADISFTGSVRVRLQLGSGVTLPNVGGTQLTLAYFDAVATHGASQVAQAFDPVLGETVLFLSPHDTPYTITLGLPAGLDITADPASHAVQIDEGGSAPDVAFTLNSITLPLGASNSPPTADFASPTRPLFETTVGVPVQFDPTGTFDAEGAWGGTWDFGDGETHAGTFGSYASSVTTHAYTTAGNYTVTWTAIDEQGATAVATSTVTVRDP